MKVSLNWLKEYLDLAAFTPEQISELLTDIGLEVEAMETVESIRGGMKGIVIGEVKEHRPLDVKNKTISVNRVDVGQGGELLSIVCGAHNVAAGQKVLVAMVGTTLYPPGIDSLTIERRKVYGEWSEGMICSQDEVGLGDDHSGIVVLDSGAEVGTPAGDYYNIETDVVYEIGLTPNRSDATNHLGVARDLAARLRVQHGHSGAVKLPSVDHFHPDRTDMQVEVRVDNYEACPRYSGLTITGLRIAESPEWLKRRLRAVGVRPINNVVDITNFILHELGQPLHAFDLEKVKGRRVIVRTLPAETPFVTLDEVERKLSAEDLMICDGDSHGMCIGGVFGGIGTGVSDSTTSIFLESAHFNPRWIRRSSTRHNLRTDAARVFEKGSDPNITVYALKRAALLMQELAGGQIASPVVDLYPNPIEPAQVEVAYQRVNTLIGIDLPRSQVKSILDALHMPVVAETDGAFTVAVPTNKADVQREADVIEEILRIYGFNQVPIPAKITTTVAIGRHPDPGEVRNITGDYLAANGFYEMMALSLSESKYYRQHASIVTPEELVYINNTSNVHLDIMRPTMLFSGLEAVVHNQNRQQTNVKLFEFGRTYRRRDAGYEERSHLSLFLTGERHPESWLAPQGGNSSYYTLRAFVEHLLDRLGISGFQETAIRDEVFAYGMRLHRGPQVLVEYGKVNPVISRGMDIRNEVFYADVAWDNLLSALRRRNIEVEELNKYPSVRRDLALVIENSIKFGDIVAIARKVGKKLIKDINLFDVYENEAQLGAGKRSYAVSFLFEDPSKTLQVKEVDEVIDRLIAELESKLDAKIRK